MHGPWEHKSSSTFCTTWRQISFANPQATFLEQTHGQMLRGIVSQNAHMLLWLRDGFWGWVLSLGSLEEMEQFLNWEGSPDGQVV